MAIDIDALKSELATAFRNGDETQAEELARGAISRGLDPLALVQTIMVPILSGIGDDFQDGRAFLPELMLAGRAAERVSDVVEEVTIQSGHATANLGTIVIGTVEGDVHDIGGNIVATMLNAHGFKVINLGRDIRASAFLDAAQKENAHILGLSALMTTTLPAQERTVRLFREVGERENFKIVIGGGATTQEWSDQIGADGYAPDAAAAVDLCKKLTDSV